MIVEATNYFAKEGLAEEVLKQRRKASEIRLALGLAAGVILVKREGAGPDVRWECRFSSRQDYEVDRAKRKASIEFEEAREHMQSLLQRFERHISEVDDPSEVAPLYTVFSL